MTVHHASSRLANSCVFPSVGYFNPAIVAVLSKQNTFANWHNAEVITIKQEKKKKKEKGDRYNSRAHLSVLVIVNDILRDHRNTHHHDFFKRCGIYISSLAHYIVFFSLLTQHPLVTWVLIIVYATFYSNVLFFRLKENQEYNCSSNSFTSVHLCLILQYVSEMVCISHFLCNESLSIQTSSSLKELEDKSISLLNISGYICG